jgi:hypothetical protein
MAGLADDAVDKADPADLPAEPVDIFGTAPPKLTHGQAGS